MSYGNVSVALLNMTADVYLQQNRQDPTTGQIKREWIFDRKIICHVDIISSEGASTPDNNKNFGEKYSQEEKFRLKTKERLSKRTRLTNLKNRSGEVIFIENDQIDTPPTIFEIESHHPRLDPLGNVLYFESNLRRVGVQSNEISN
jgi:hypothetical protein